MEDADVKQRVYDLLMEQPTLSMASDAHFVQVIYEKFGKIATSEQVAAARQALKELADKEAVEGIPVPEAHTKGSRPDDLPTFE
jgi:hypothetical protein